LSLLLSQGEEAFSNGELIDPPSESAYYFAAQMLAIERNNSPALRLRVRVKDALLKEAEALAARGDLKGALEKHERIVRLFPEDKRIPGRIRALNDQLAQQQQQNVISMDPRKRRESGLQKYAGGDYAGAAADLEIAVKNGLADSDTFYYLGLAEWKRGRVSDAIKSLNQALEQNPSHVSSIAVLGQIAESRKETAAALAYYERAWKAGGSADYSLNFLQKKIELLKDDLQPQEKAPDSFSARAVHEHTFGSCSGTLEVTARGVRYLSSTSDHGFSVPLNGVSDLNPSADKISLRADDKKYTFKFPDRNGERFRQAYYDFFRAGSSK
jgi:tetratricopeptide (TPR) repeat protein